METKGKIAPDYAGHSGAHTAGPWEVRNGCNVFATNEDGTLEYLAVTGGLSGRDMIDRDAANAHLIAAAPDLLHVAKRLAYAAGMAPGQDRLAAFQIVAEEARAAIAKAEGRANA